MRRPWRSSRRAKEAEAAEGEAAPAEPPIFFIHVMKTGGTTVFRHLRQTYGLDEIYPYRPLDIKYDGDLLDIEHHLSVSYLCDLPPERRRSIKIYTGHFPFVASDLMGGDFTRVTVLRDPVDRTVSLLRQFRRKAPWMNDPEQQMPLATRTLEEVYEHPHVFEPLIHNHQTKIFSMQAADQPTSYMDVIDVDASRLEIAKASLARVDVLGLTERYDDFLDDVQERFGWAVERAARKNATPESEIRPVSPALLRRIVEDNAIDIELYEHATRLHAERRGGRPGGA